MLTIDIFGFQALWSPYYFLILAVTTAFYFMIVGPWRHKINGSEPVSTRQKVYFVSGMILLYAIKGSPVDLMGHIMFSLHMTQMALLYLAVAPLLLMGIPSWLIRFVFQVKILEKLVYFLTKPLIALIVFNGLFSLYHIPEVFDVVKIDPILHAVYTSVLFVTAVFMWWLVVDPLPEWKRLSSLKKIGYMFANGVLITPACALLIFAETPLFDTYTNPALWAESMKLCVTPGTLSSLNLSGPELFSPLPVTEDQQLGGIVMKLLQEVIYGLAIGYIFFSWARREREKDQTESNFYPQPTE